MAPIEPAESLDRRQRRWLQLHDKIYEAACELFLHADVDSTSVGEIAERADVARKTAFNHFPRKRDFISEWGKRRRAHVLEVLSEELLSRPSLDTVLRHYYTELAKLNEGDRPLTIRMLLGWRGLGGPFDDDPHQMVDQVVGFVAAAQERGEISPRVHPEWVATMLYSTYFGILYDWCKGPDDEPLFDLQEALMQLVGAVVDGLVSSR